MTSVATKLLPIASVLFTSLFASVALLELGGCRSEVANTRLEPGISSQLQDLADSRPDLKDSLFSLETASDLQTVLERYVKTSEVPGAVLAIASAQRSWMGATGKANLESQTSIQPTDRFRIGSLSEMFIAVICLQLVESGDLNLKDNLTDGLPPDLYRQIPHSDWITIRQLLNHTSGIPDLDRTAFQQAVADDPQHRWSARELLNFMLDRPATNPRGTFAYSSANYLLLQLIIERVTGEPLAKVMQTRIIQPLSLKRTSVELRADQLAHGYQDWNQDGTAEDVTTLNTGLGLGSNAVSSSAPDLIHFLHALFFENSLLEPDSMQQMLTLVETNSGSYGLGISHTMTRWGEVWGQVSHTTGFSTVAFYLPAHDLMIVSWTNSGDPSIGESIQLAEDSLTVILGHSSRISRRIGGG